MLKFFDIKGKKLSGFEVATFSCGALARELCNNCINVFLLVYLSVYMGLNPLILTVAFFVARLWDTVNDPILAAVVNNCRISKKLGQFRPWLLIGALLNFGCTIGLFANIGGPIAAKYVYYILMYILWGMTFTVFDVPYWSMIPSIANTTEERNSVTSWARLVGGFGGFLIGMIGTSLIIPAVVKSGKSIYTAYMLIGTVAGAMTLFFMLMTIIFNRERYVLPKSKLAVKDVFAIFKGNKQLGVYAIMFVLFMIGSSIALSQLLYIYVYCYDNGADFFNKEFSYTMFWIIACTVQGLAMIFYNQIARKIPREKIVSISMLISAFGLLTMFSVFFLFKPGMGNMGIYWLNTVLMGVSAAFYMLGQGMFSIGATVMLADVVDYGEYLTGKRGDSLIFSVQTLLTKFAGALAMLILGVGITVAKLPTIREYYDENIGAMVQQFVNNAGQVVELNVNSTSLLILRVFMFLIPIPLVLIAYFIYKKKYWLYGDKYNEIKAEAEKRRNTLQNETAAAVAATAELPSDISLSVETDDADRSNVTPVASEEDGSLLSSNLDNTVG